MSYARNCLADIAMKSSQRAAPEAEQRAFLRKGGKITEVPGFAANSDPTATHCRQCCRGRCKAFGMAVKRWAAQQPER